MWKKYVPIGLAVLVLVVLAAALWYSRPLTIEELCPGIHLEACTAVSFDYSTFEMQNMADCTQNLRLEGEDLPPLLEHLQGRKFRRSPFSWLTGSGRVHPWREGDFRWFMRLAFEDVPVRDGTGSGFVLRLDNYFGELGLSFDDKIWCVTTKDQEQWVADILVLFQAASGRNTVSRSSAAEGTASAGQSGREFYMEGRRGEVSHSASPARGARRNSGATPDRVSRRSGQEKGVRTVGSAAFW